MIRLATPADLQIITDIIKIALLQKFDFIEGGRIPDAIHYEDEFRDHLYMFKKL